ncbi:hypothetical protein [Noviherbaspirillum autotrophicum]|uniref:hypothetical protein n=1 Tax=Noviherbaspirillum autotrophicum TaxID=709839 RepID=UPI0005895FFB|nr:hypothetical protein [Noviherbaspirillum autotrophicum]
MEANIDTAERHAPWNKGKLSGQKARLNLREIGEVRTRSPPVQAAEVGGSIRLAASPVIPNGGA